jgi:NADPH:quinone reductase-like Zn-dependent oxidoreductase
MKAIVIESLNSISLIEKPKPRLSKEGDVLVKVNAAALNHRDQWIREGKYPGIRFGVTLGSDGSGVVEQVYSESDSKLLGKEVIINPNLNWGDQEDYQSTNYSILGMPTDGTFAEYVVVNADRIHEKPEYLDLNEAAAIPLAGLTAYRSLFMKGNLQSNSRVLITGIGGGVAQCALQLALAQNCKVDVLSTSNSKIENSISLGANAGFNIKEENWSKNAKDISNGYHLILDSVGGDYFNALIDLLMPGGRIVFYGASAGTPGRVDLYKLFWKQAALIGSTMGSDKEFQLMLDYYKKNQLKPKIDKIFTLENYLDAFDRLKRGEQMGKLLISMV